MKKWLRRTRGAVGMGLTWAVAWFGAGVALLLVVGVGAPRADGVIVGTSYQPRPEFPDK